MEHHRLLYKINGSVMSPRDSKSKTANEIRANKRSELYSLSRNLCSSPSPTKQKGLSDEQKENVKPSLFVEPVQPAVTDFKEEQVTSSEPLASNVDEKLSRKKAHLMRFMAWKAEKQKQDRLKEKKNKQPPFVVPTRCPVTQEQEPLKKPSIAPRNHTFRPPDNLQDLRVEVVGVSSIRCVNGTQQEVYHFVETPKKKNNVVSKAKSANARAVPVSKPIVKNSMQKIIPKPPVTASITTKTPKLIPSTANCKKTPAADSKKTPAACSKQIPATDSKKTPAVHTNVPPLPKPLQTATVKREIKPGKPPIRPKIPPLIQAPLRPQSNIPSNSKMAPPSQRVLKVTKKPQPSTVSSKCTSSKLGNSRSELPPLKRPTFKSSKKASTSVSNALLAVNRNARSNASNALPALKLNGKSLLQSMAETTTQATPIPETPTDNIPADAFLNFVTSTKRRSVSKDSNADLPFANLGMTIIPHNNCFPTPIKKSKVKSAEQLDFVRYSIVQSDVHNIAHPEEVEQKTAEHSCRAIPQGWMSAQKRDKSNSTCMTSDKIGSTANEHPTLATVHYYRKQLMDEIARLDNHCRIWEEYRERNVIKDDGVDMINLTIGQTKLLTTKKLKQFGGLIDRCENGVLGESSACNRGGDDARPILPEDLEGFWSMVGLQIENVDKRFANLERWKANNWSDPDEVPIKTNKTLSNIKKVKKCKPMSTARPNSALQKMLKTAHAAYLQNKAIGGADEDVILTPKSRKVLIRDRRSRSSAATVITVNTPRSSRKSSASEATPTATDPSETPKLMPHIGRFRKSMNLLHKTLLNEHEKKTPASPLRHQAQFRKSILKTPGSMCRRKSVVFNSPTLKFTIEDEVENPEAISGIDEQEDLRTYKLRNRRIVLRDSAEFEIPK